MEDFGTLRGGAAMERTKVSAIRGISDLVDGKEGADAAGSQPLAAANAAAFTFEMLAIASTTKPGAEAAQVDRRAILVLGAELYSQGAAAACAVAARRRRRVTTVPRHHRI